MKKKIDKLNAADSLIFKLKNKLKRIWEKHLLIKNSIEETLAELKETRG